MPGPTFLHIIKSPKIIIKRKQRKEKNLEFTVNKVNLKAKKQINLHVNI